MEDDIYGEWADLLMIDPLLYKGRPTEARLKKQTFLILLLFGRYPNLDTLKACPYPMERYSLIRPTDYEPNILSGEW